MHIIRCVYKHKIKEVRRGGDGKEEAEDGAEGTQEEAPSATCHQGRGLDGSTVQVNLTRVPQAPMLARGFHGSPDGGSESKLRIHTRRGSRHRTGEAGSRKRGADQGHRGDEETRFFVIS